MVFEEVKTGARGARALIAQTYSLAHLKVKLQQRQWAPSGKRRMKPLGEGQHLNKGD
jgi:hypothetical protein